VIGNFDGVHQGHEAVLSAVYRLARSRELRPTMLTFQPHPAVTLGRQPPAVLTTLARKLELVERSCPGIEVVVREFTLPFARQSPEQFVRDVLVAELRAAVVMVGLNFRFGRDRSGGFGDLERFGEALGFEAIAEPLVSDAQGACSSSRVRALIAAGELDAAQAMLGRPHMLSGRVAPGDGRGKTLGFATCNLAQVAEALPPNGVYAVLVDIVDPTSGPQSLARGVANIGVRPTVASEASEPRVEAHLFDFDGDLYGCHLRVHLMSFLRPERRFADLDALKRQIAEDAERARDVLGSSEPDPQANGAWA
jgi:riboflavin kinase/FMN adenylyltransferase